MAGAHEIATRELEEIGVKVLTGVSYSDDAPIAQEYDAKVDCRGFKFTGPNKFMTEDSIRGCVEPTTGQIMVDAHLNVTSKHPLVPQKDAEVKTNKRIFSFGDVCLTPMNEEKSIVSMYQYAAVLAGNIEVAVGGDGALQNVPERLHMLQVIPLGKTKGIMQINGMT